MIFHCPDCHQEFDQGVSRCSDCSGQLLEGPAPVAQVEEPKLGPLDALGDLVVAGSSPNEAEIRFLEGLLRSEQIPTRVTTRGVSDLGVFSGTPVTYHLLSVPRENQEDAVPICTQFREHRPLEDVQFSDPVEEEAPQAKPAAPRKPAYGTGGSALLTLVFAASVAIAVGFSIMTPPYETDPAGIYRYRGGGSSFLMVGTLAFAALLGGGLGVWVSRRKIATRAVLLLLLAIFVVPLLVNTVWALASLL
ncbi:MAG: hypothetical protein V2A76_12680 [Planctomycetota bacterium]